MATKSTSTNKSRITPERVIEKPTETKSKKIKMLCTYISDVLCLYDGKVYEIPSTLANILIHNREAESC